LVSTLNAEIAGQPAFLHSNPTLDTQNAALADFTALPKEILIENDSHKHLAQKFAERYFGTDLFWVAVISAKNHERQRRKRQSVTAKREKSQTPKVLT